MVMPKERLVMPKEQLVLISPRLILRPYTLNDAQHLVLLLSDPDVTRYTLIPRPFTSPMAKDWIASRPAKYSRGESVNYAVTLDDELIGGTGLQLDPQPNKAVLNYWLAHKFWNKGITTEATRRLIQHAFDDLGLNRVEATHVPENRYSGKVLAGTGFKYEGRMKHATTSRDADKQYDDLMFYGIVRGDYERFYEMDPEPPPTI